MLALIGVVGGYYVVEKISDKVVEICRIPERVINSIQYKYEEYQHNKRVEENNKKRTNYNELVRNIKEKYNLD